MIQQNTETRILMIKQAGATVKSSCLSVYTPTTKEDPIQNPEWFTHYVPQTIEVSTISLLRPYDFRKM